MADSDQVFFENPDTRNVPSKEEASPTADQLIADREEAKSSNNIDSKEVLYKKENELPKDCMQEEQAHPPCKVEDTTECKIEKEEVKRSSCKEEEDTKLKQSESGALLSCGGEFEAEPNQPDKDLNDIQTNSDIRFFICGSCKYNPILIGSIPKLLPCLHSFCENCLKKRYEIQKLSSNDGCSSPRLKCPSCGQEFLVAGNDKPISAFLNNQFVIESTPSKGKGSKEQEDHQCTSCDDGSKASSYCMNCNEWLCDACVSAHQRVKVTKDHIIQGKCAESVLAESPQGEVIETKHKPLYCKVHTQEQLKLFCANCEKLTCRDCQLIEHKDHRYQFIDEAASRHREILKKLLQYLQINLGLLKDTISDVEKVSDGLSSQEKEIENKINHAFNTLILSIKSRQDALVKELHSLVVNKQVLLSKQKKDLTQMKVILEHNHDFADFAVKGGSNVALLYSRKVLGTRLHNLNSLKYRQRPLASLDLKFNLDVEKLQNYFSKVGSIFSQEDVQRKLDNYNSSSTNASTQRSIALTSRILQSNLKNPIDSMNSLNKRLNDTSQPTTKFINLSKQGALGMPVHQAVRAAAKSLHNSSSGQRHSMSTTSSQQMIVLSSPHSSRQSYVQSDGKGKSFSRYSHYSSNREHHLNRDRDNHHQVNRDRSNHHSFQDQSRDMSRISPKTPSELKGFQYPHLQSRDISRNSSISSPVTDHGNMHWSSKINLNMENIRKVSENSNIFHRKTLDSSSSSLPRSSSTRSNGSEGSGHSLPADNMVVVKQEIQSPDSCQSNFTSVVNNLFISLHIF